MEAHRKMLSGRTEHRDQAATLVLMAKAASSIEGLVIKSIDVPIAPKRGAAAPVPVAGRNEPIATLHVMMAAQSGVDPAVQGERVAQQFAQKSGLTAQITLSAKATAQQRETDMIHKWNQSFTALNTFEKTWRQTIPAQDSVKDLVSLIGQTSLAPLSWPDTHKLSVVSDDGRADLHVYHICLSDGSGGIELRASSASEIILGLEKLSTRHDLSFNGVKLTSDKDGAAVRFNEFCVLLRGPDHV